MKISASVGTFLLTALALPGPGAYAAHHTTAVLKDFVADPPVGFTAPIEFDQGGLVMNTTSFSGADGKSELTYNAATRKLWHIDHAKKTYVEIDERLLRGVSDGVQAAVDFVGGLFKGEEDDSDDASLRVRATGERRKLLGAWCQKYVVEQGGHRAQEIWLARWDDVNLGPDDFASVRQLASSADRILNTLKANPLLQALPHVPLHTASQMEGFPILIQHFQGEKVAYEILLHPPEETEQKLDPARPPEGYHRRLM